MGLYTKMSGAQRSNGQMTFARDVYEVESERESEREIATQRI